jgi:hypothetical protein
MPEHYPKPDNSDMRHFDPVEFWARFQTFVDKDLPITIKTGIKQPTLSLWRTRKTYPRADDAVRIAEALGTTVEYLVTGSDKTLYPFNPAAVEIAQIAYRLSATGLKTLRYVAKGLLTQLPQKK